MQLCEDEEATRDDAANLIEQLVELIRIEKHIPLLKQREETRRAVERMLDVIAHLIDGLCEYLSSNRISSLSCSVDSYRKLT